MIRCMTGRMVKTLTTGLSRPIISALDGSGASGISLAIGTAAWVGDSQTDRSSGTDVGSAATKSYSYATWTRILSGETFATAKNTGRGDYDFGYSGETAAQILSRMSTINAASADTLIVQAGVNSLTGGRGVSGTIADVVAIWDSGLAAGKQIVGVEIFPHSLEAINSAADEVNDGLATAARSRGILFVRFDDTLREGDAAGAVAKAAYLEDGTHYNQVGCKAIAAQVVEQITPYVTAVSPFPAQGHGSVISSNYFWEAGFDGNTKPNGWDLVGSATCAYSRVAAADGGPDWVEVAVTNNASTLSWLRNYITSGFSIGDVVHGIAEVQIVSGTINVFDLVLYHYAITTVTANYSPNTEPTRVPAFSGGVFKTPPLAVPASTTQLRHQLQFRGNGVFRFRKAAIVKP